MNYIRKCKECVIFGFVLELLFTYVSCLVCAQRNKNQSLVIALSLSRCLEKRFGFSIKCNLFSLFSSATHKLSNVEIKINIDDNDKS